jgi:hypothetical protein
MTLRGLFALLGALDGFDNPLGPFDLRLGTTLPERGIGMLLAFGIHRWLLEIMYILQSREYAYTRFASGQFAARKSDARRALGTFHQRHDRLAADTRPADRPH